VETQLWASAAPRVPINHEFRLYRESSRRAVAIDADTGDEATDEFVRAISEAVSRYTMALAERQIRAAFERSQAEIAHLSQRTSEGMETARLKGKRIGRQKGEAVETRKVRDANPLIRDLAKRYGGQYTNEQVMRMCGVSRNTYYAYCRDIDAEIEREEAQSGAA
jgi:DNA invertase Pin-like site-specific DNA recombinase